MSNVELVKRVYAAMPDRDWGTLDDLLHPDVELLPPADVPDFETYRGLDGIRLYQQRTEEIWEKFDTWAEEIFEAGDQVLALARSRGLARQSGVEVEIEVGHVWTVRDGRVSRLVIYTDREEARRAAGLESRARHPEEDSQ